MLKAKIVIVFLLLYVVSLNNISGQSRLEFSGQLSLYGNYGPDSEMDYFFGGRYLPKLNYEIPLKSEKLIDFEVAANIYGAFYFSSFDSIATDGDINFYRIWARYTGKQFEIRLGLQKIDFGSAFLLRPLQWFDEIDPRDPLKFTNGVYGGLGRYYFLNNANIWLWILYGNENQRGYELFKTYPNHPEFGGRIQYPVPKGEIALSYHHRTVDTRDNPYAPTQDLSPENKFGLDGKWDVKVGLWFEATYIHKSADMGILTNQSYLTLGTDYTFGLGNGLNVILEHLVGVMDEEPFQFSNTSNTTATSLSYPLGLSSTISSVLFYNWDAQKFSFFINYQHNFKRITGYIMAYYNPDIMQEIGVSEFTNLFPGPGVRLMVVWDH